MLLLINIVNLAKNILYFYLYEENSINSSTEQNYVN